MRSLVWSVDVHLSTPTLPRHVSLQMEKLWCPWHKHRIQVEKKTGQYITAWWFFAYPSEKHELISWDDDTPNIWKNKRCYKHQSDKILEI